MHLLRALLRIFILLLLLLLGLFIAICNRCFSKTLYAPLTQHWFRLVAAVMGLRIHRYAKTPQESLKQPQLYVCNHISWADIVVIGASVPDVVFLSKIEIANWPIIGLLVRMAGTLFIQRGKDANVAVALISSHLQHGGKVVIFPEGRTSIGRTVKRFYPRLFKAAEWAQVTTIPMALRYTDENDSRIQDVNFADERHFLHSLWDALCYHQINAKLTFGEPMPSCLGRDEMARRAHAFARNWVDNEIPAVDCEIKIK